MSIVCPYDLWNGPLLQAIWDENCCFFHAAQRTIAKGLSVPMTKAIESVLQGSKGVVMVAIFVAQDVEYACRSKGRRMVVDWK